MAVAARAQQTAMPVIGLLDVINLPGSGRLAAIEQGLGESGYVFGHNVAIEIRSAEGRLQSVSGVGGRSPSPPSGCDRRSLARSPAALAAKAASTTVPIVFTVAGDPIQLGLVASFNLPGSNATGINFFTAELAAKRLGLLRELVPAATRVAVLGHRFQSSNHIRRPYRACRSRCGRRDHG